jgi:hypothetical protein
VECCTRTLGADRVIFGTDVPLHNPWPQLEKVHQVNLSEAERDLLMGGNILRLMGVAA